MLMPARRAIVYVFGMSPTVNTFEAPVVPTKSG